jgi:hypothetical protein
LNKEFLKLGTYVQFLKQDEYFVFKKKKKEGEGKGKGEVVEKEEADDGDEGSEYEGEEDGDQEGEEDGDGDKKGEDVKIKGKGLGNSDVALKFDKITRLKVQNCIIESRRTQDITEWLILKNVTSADDYKWQKFIRYNLVEDRQVIELSCLYDKYDYQNEYIGPGQRLILTPMTEKAWGSLLISLKNSFTPSVTGPIGVGKSSTI